MKARKAWSKIFKVLREKTHQPGILYLVNILQSEGKTKIFSDEQKLKEYMVSRPNLQKSYKKELWREGK